MTTPGGLHLEMVIGCLHVLVPELCRAEAQGSDWEVEPAKMPTALHQGCKLLCSDHWNSGG